MASYPPGTSMSGIVTACRMFGVFILLDELPNVPALLELIHFQQVETEPNCNIEYPTDYPAVGSLIETRILSWCLLPKDVRLTQLSHLNCYYSSHD